ncbi:MAG TPA: PAS domain S-box protein [Salegentibacter sp.]|uniref:PAS domain S-box protein n=1 Tax=Salegentibacter sp. TaxID=1903072 RepID=UPI002F95B65F
MQEPLIIINEDFRIIGASRVFKKRFALDVEEGNDILKALPGLDKQEFKAHLQNNENSGKKPSGVSVNLFSRKKGLRNYILKPASIKTPRGQKLYLLNFKKLKNHPPVQGKEKNFLRVFKEIFSNAPASICTLKGPTHIFEVANDNYLQLVGNRDILGKTVKEALPEIGKQGFLELLDKVYNTGEPFIGNEINIKLENNEGESKETYLNFVYQPTRNQENEIDGIFVHAVDVTEQVLSRKKVEENETRLRDLVDTVPAIIWIAHPEGGAKYLNRNWYEFTGQKNNEALQRGWLEAVHPDDLEYALSTITQGNLKQEAYSNRFRIKSKDGNYRWVVNYASPKFGLNGEFEGMVGTVVDIHEERRKEKIIKEKQHLTETIVREADVATAIYFGKDMQISLANDAMIKLWGKSRNVIGKKLMEALPELEGQPFFELLERVYITGETYWGKEDKVQLMIGDKLQTGYYNFTYKALRNEQGKIYGILNMAIDVSEMVKSKNLLKESESHFRQMADLMPGKVNNTDADGNNIYFNQNWLEFTGLDSESLKKQGWTHFIHQEDREEFDSLWKKSLQSGKDFEMELRLKDKNGNYKWHLSRAEAVKGENNKIQMWIGTNTGIHKLKEEEQRKEDFLKMVSHELKTPITSIKGYVQLLLSMLRKAEMDIPGNIPLKPSLQRIDHQITRLTRLISEILDLTRIEENKLELEKQKFNLNELLDETVQDITLTNSQHKIEVQHNFKAEIIADRDRIGQVLINLVTNGIKYSPHSDFIKISTHKAEKERIKVSVQDYGIGIAKSDQKNIFKRFFRIGKKDEDTYSGFGIGLFLAKEIIDRHNGEIKIKSAPGKGSEFSFFLDTAE